MISLHPKWIPFCPPATALNKYRVPTNTLVNSSHYKWMQEGCVFKNNDLKDENSEDVYTMKIAPVPFFVVQDRLAEDLDTLLLFERIT